MARFDLNFPQDLNGVRHERRVKIVITPPPPPPLDAHTHTHTEMNVIDSLMHISKPIKQNEHK